MDGAIAHLQQKLPADLQLHSHLSSDLGTALPLHISLSRPIVLVTENKDAFGEELSKAIANLNLQPYVVASVPQSAVPSLIR